MILNHNKISCIKLVHLLYLTFVRFTLCKIRQIYSSTGSGVQPASYSAGTGVLSRG